MGIAALNPSYAGFGIAKYAAYLFQRTKKGELVCVEKAFWFA